MTDQFTPHTGNEMPVPPETTVAYHVVGGEGVEHFDRACDLCWGPGVGEPDGLGRTIDYRIVGGTK